MKIETKKRVALYGFYALFVIMLLMGTRCESRVHLTTPEKDAKHIAELAETVHTEAELRAVEKIASEYEIAYRKSYGGAKALYFKSLYEPVMDKAGERRAAYRAEEEYVASLEAALAAHLNDLERAWQMPLGDEAEELAKLQANIAEIERLDGEMEVLVAKKEQLAMDIIEAGYPQDMLDQIGHMEADIATVAAAIKEVEHTNTIIVLANRLQLGREITIATEEAETVEEVEVI